MRGYQKKVIYLKNTGSRHFEEAYFVMRSDNDSSDTSKQRMIEEANKIIEENFGSSRRGFLYSKRWHILSFFIGCAASVILLLVIGLANNII